MFLSIVVESISKISWSSWESGEVPCIWCTKRKPVSFSSNIPAYSSCFWYPLGNLCQQATLQQKRTLCTSLLHLAAGLKGPRPWLRFGRVKDGVSLGECAYHCQRSCGLVVGNHVALQNGQASVSGMQRSLFACKQCLVWFNSSTTPQVTTMAPKQTTMGSCPQCSVGPTNNQYPRKEINPDVRANDNVEICPNQ